MFNAILVEQTDQQGCAAITQLETASLPPGNVLVRVEWSTLNYKDALAITGKGAVVRRFPMVPGIDLAGVVEHSEHPEWTAGDRVLLNGWGIGEEHWGGLAQYARVDGDWLTRLPPSLNSHQAMAIGTAGYTAMLSVLALERHGLTPERGEVLVTGANGGVGSYAIALLAARGYHVIAATGRPQESAFLERLGAAEIIDRSELSKPGKPLARARWFAAIDSVGSHTLANLCAMTRPDGLIAACGLAQGMDFPATVAPFILRGISLLGINSVTRPAEERQHAWARLAEDIDPALLGEISRDIRLSDTLDASEQLLEGTIRGRLVVDVNS
ncbi:acrylyl-CoA reductase (NADPH) [Kushneria phyllosphaerae]|uniref:Acrylyl-CoA reductase AcuI n=1 Tax=Kushneria phyllosphaerae TaxID=2100822 RepID=A0A2R8CI32_9GAMM|nr:MDR family oxidoreductase [Kushneria phyllosphaerae]SPJ32462.1 Acrylyl-CoA reductase AcuI [Kushneria phyllosphaerae]